MLPRKLKHECSPGGREATHSSYKLPGPVFSRSGSTTSKSAIVLPQAALVVRGVSNVHAPLVSAAAQQVTKHPKAGFGCSKASRVVLLEQLTGMTKGECACKRRDPRTACVLVNTGAVIWRELD